MGDQQSGPTEEIRHEGKVNTPLRADVDIAEDLSGLRDEACLFLQASPHKPYEYCPQMSASARCGYVWELLLRSHANGAVTFLAREGGTIQALLQMEHLAWDTEVLRFSVARITWWLGALGPSGLRWRQQLLRWAIDESRKRGERYLLIRLPAADIEGIHQLEASGFRLVDGVLTFGCDLSQLRPEEEQSVDGLRISATTAADVPALEETAAASFRIDRFHSDPFIGQERADELHRQWVRSSCQGFADCVLVAYDGDPIGFTTLKLDSVASSVAGVGIGLVVLVAVAPSSRRRGVARQLTLASLAWFRATGCSWVEVGTQLANIRASRVYESAGFSLVGSSLTFRLLL